MTNEAGLQVPDGIDWAKLNAYVMEKYRCGAYCLPSLHSHVLNLDRGRVWCQSSHCQGLGKMGNNLRSLLGALN